ncbi:hypothetical protein, partial [Streptomyces sp. NPDC058294]|uniref:hypothetical protein n=1 Tax=Streptomyces sp. NPDC058294 TaxID=3346430 RepID=UPI0036F007E3
PRHTFHTRTERSTVVPDTGTRADPPHCVSRCKKLAVKPIDTEYGTLFQLLGHQSGLAGAINQFNIRFAYDVAASTEVSTPKVKPAKAEAGRQPAIMEAEFASEQELLQHLNFIEGRLTAAEKARKYDLKEDLAVSGQSERATYHVVRYHVGDEVWDSVGSTAGSNRTRHRHALFGIQAAAGLLGLNQSALGGPTGQRWRNPADWRDRYTTLLNKYAEFDPEDIEIPDDPDAAAEAQGPAVGPARRRRPAGRGHQRGDRDRVCPQGRHAPGLRCGAGLDQPAHPPARAPRLHRHQPGDGHRQEAG